MSITPFLLERHFAKYEFDVPYQLSCSDCEPLTMQELIDWSSHETDKLWNELTLTYTESAGHPLLREEISKLYQDVVADDILVCVPEEGIYITMEALLQTGDRVVVQYPAYQSLFEIARNKRCQVDLWKTNQAGSFNIDELFALLKEAPRMLVINSPHNPTGTHFSRDEFDAIVSYCSEKGILLFSDEMYWGLEQDPEQQLPSAATLEPNAVSLSGMSKSFAMPGLRIGWLVCRDPRQCEALITMKDYTTICSSSPSEILALMGIQNRERIWQRNVSIIKENSDRVNELVHQFPEFLWWQPPIAGSVSYLYFKSPLIANRICEQLLHEKQTLAIGSSLFQDDAPAIRLGLGRKAFPQALERLCQILLSY